MKRPSRRWRNRRAGGPSSTRRRNWLVSRASPIRPRWSNAVSARRGSRHRLHSGDTSIYSAIQEQMALLDDAGVTYEVIPGISSFQAAAAALKTELTLPETVQTIILTRGAGDTPMPQGEALEDLAKHRASL